MERKPFGEYQHQDYLFAINGLLDTIEIEIKSNLTEYEGSNYVKDYVC